MPKLNPIAPRQFIKILSQLGFSLLRIKGSHHFFSHPDGRTTVIPIHGNEELSIGILKKILRDISLSAGDFQEKR
ncbi:MAG TPA: type II toxin-antitoxin system HicA family toxin [Candidatus Absconditabacterales bacterium]|nr:type II toxin-antitoxin system HicA family toxin [Candidatus Absconditabacterales bacterium]HMT27214.1 type II toxin-antitoxin system HicA family toxin [Candidatus Absconditabacterales bacterium]